jgi:hypothetical protein
MNTFIEPKHTLKPQPLRQCYWNETQTRERGHRTKLAWFINGEWDFKFGRGENDNNISGSKVVNKEADQLGFFPEKIFYTQFIIRRSRYRH